jgi:predicted phosphoadenosine phosphosulfate sulfurtransferase
MPDYPYVNNSENQKFDFYTPEITFEDFVTYIAEWYGKGEKVASLLGIRSDESLNRYRTIMSNKKEKYQGLSWSTLIRGRAYNFYPIYDWTVEDIWTYNGKFKKDYNHLYDLFYKAGVSVHKMRVDEPFGNEEKASLNMFRILEPSTWARVANRVSGANFGNIYSGNKIMTHRYQLPKGHTWKSFTEFLLSTLPKEIASNYRKRFKRFIDYWTMVGCPVNDGHVSILEEKYSNSIINTHTFSNRGNGDKEVVLFKEVLDEIPEIDSKTDVLSWRRMAMCIIKNDYVCKGLSFSITKNMTVRELQILKKYENI